MTVQRDPCPGCGRLVAYARRVRRSPSDRARVAHKCPHGRPCIAWASVGGLWWRGSWRHWQACSDCAEAARKADDTQPGALDCWQCGTPLPFDPGPFGYYCPSGGAVYVRGVHCAKCGEESAFGITVGADDRERVTRIALPQGAPS